MRTVSLEQKRIWMDVFNSVLALYMTLRENPQMLRVKPVECKCGEVKDLPLDFIIDVEQKASRKLDINHYRMFLRVAQTGGDYFVFPEYMKLDLGEVWWDNGLGVDGAYARLYFKIKNDQERPRGKEDESNIDADLDSYTS
jgi:hypothetical protein